jgi:hypothetical protein
MRHFLLLLPLLLVACAADKPSSKPVNHLGEPQGREFNPVSRKYEWRTPGQPPVSPGADNTSRQPYR